MAMATDTMFIQADYGDDDTNGNTQADNDQGEGEEEEDEEEAREDERGWRRITREG